MTAPEYLDPVRHELHQLRAGADRTPRDPACVPTPGQAWAELLAMEPDERLRILGIWLDQSEQAARCFVMDHEGRIDHLGRDLDEARTRVRLLTTDRATYSAALEQAEARVEALTQELATALAKVARVEALADAEGDLDNGILVWDLRAALADKEPTP